MIAGAIGGVYAELVERLYKRNETYLSLAEEFVTAHRFVAAVKVARSTGDTGHGTVNAILKRKHGVLVAVESRRTGEIDVGAIKVKILQSDSDIKCHEICPGVLPTLCGDATRCNAMLHYVEKMVTAGDEEQSIETILAYIMMYLTLHITDEAHKVTTFLVGFHMGKVTSVFVDGIWLSVNYWLLGDVCGSCLDNTKLIKIYARFLVTPHSEWINAKNCGNMFHAMEHLLYTCKILMCIFLPRPPPAT